MQIAYVLLMPKLTTAMPVHEHECYEFHYVVSGEGRFRSGDRRFPIRRGDFFYDEPGISHRASARGARPFLLQYAVGLFLDPKRDRRIVGDLAAGLPAGRRWRLGDGHQLYFERLRRRYASGDPALIRAAAFGFVGLLYEMIGGDVEVRSGHPVVESALRHIHSSMGVGLSLGDLTDRFGLSKAYFVRLFKKYVGVSPVRYADGLRMELASELLATTDLRLADIAERVGFADEYQFSKRFRQWCGSPPGRYRRRAARDERSVRGDASAPPRGG